MDGLYTLARSVVGFMAIITLGGVVWFGSSLRNQILVAGVLLGCSSLVASLVPQRKLSSRAATAFLVAVSVIGTGAGVVLLADDLGEFPAIEWDVLSARILHVAALGTLAMRALRAPAKGQNVKEDR
jgi:hypothetical protein